MAVPRFPDGEEEKLLFYRTNGLVRSLISPTSQISSSINYGLIRCTNISHTQLQFIAYVEK